MLLNDDFIIFLACLQQLLTLRAGCPNFGDATLIHKYTQSGRRQYAISYYTITSLMNKVQLRH